MTVSLVMAGYPPTEFWELIELVMAGCPEEPLKAFRKAIIGRNKPLKARHADNAIRGARSALIPEGDGSTESHANRDVRARWYVRNGYALVMARAAGDEWTPNQLAIMSYAWDCYGDGDTERFSLLEFDATAVDHIPVPALITTPEVGCVRDGAGS